MRTVQRNDGTFKKVLGPVEVDLYNKISQETKGRTQKDSELEGQLSDLNDACNALFGTVGALDNTLTNEEAARKHADQSLQEQINQIGITENNGYSKEEMKHLLVPWKVEEIDIPYIVPDNKYFDELVSIKSIRVGYLHQDRCNLDIPRSNQFGINTMRRYTLWIYFETGATHELKVTYDNKVAIYLNGSKIELPEKTYDLGPEIVALDFKSGWNRIQVLIAQDQYECGLKVEHNLTDIAQGFACLDYPAGVIDRSIIGMGAVGPEQIDQTQEYELRQLTAYEVSIEDDRIMPAIKAGDGIRGAIQVGNALLEKNGSELIIHGSLRATGSLAFGSAAETIDNRTAIIINPLQYDREIGIEVDDIRCWNSKGLQVQNGTSLEGFKVLDGFDEKIHYGNCALTLRMLVSDNSVPGTALKVQVHNESGIDEYSISATTFIKANTFELVGINFQYTGAAPGKQGLGLTFIYPNNVGIIIDYGLLTMTSPVSVELPQHAHDNLYMPREEISTTLDIKSDKGHQHEVIDIVTDTNNQFVSQAEKDAWNSKADISATHDHANKIVLDSITAAYTIAEQNKLTNIESGANNYVHPVTHSPVEIATDVDNQFVSQTEKDTWNSKADGVHEHDLSIVTILPTTGKAGQCLMFDTGIVDTELEMHVCTKAGDGTVTTAIWRKVSLV